MSQKHKVIFFLVAIIIGAYLYSKYRIAPELDVNKIQLSDNKGNELLLSELKDKNSVVVFFASWCGPCIQETPHLEEMKKQLSEDDFRYIAISDESFDKIDYFQRRTQSSFEFYKLNQAFKEIGVYTIPTVYILNRKGEIIFNHVGNYDWQSPETIEIIKNLTEN